MGRSVNFLIGTTSVVVSLSTFSSTTLAGPYVETGIPSNSPLIKGWATGVSELVRGRQDYSNPTSPLATFGAASDALGPASGAVAGEGALSVVSLGDAGSITVTFDTPIANGSGADFAVYENTFLAGMNAFAELGFVEVSSNGSDFFRFASVSLTQTTTQVGSFGTIDPTNVYNLAGKHVSGQGTPFDLNELVGVSSLLNVNAVSHVRIIDVIGTIGTEASLDSLGNIINDSYKTPFPTGGFDLDAVAVLNVAVPEPTGVAMGAMVLAGTLLRRRSATR